jgi:hypothetical protein
MSISEQVAESLQNAIENGFEVASWTPDFLTDDLMAFDADLEKCSRADVLAAVKEWLAHREVSGA